MALLDMAGEDLEKKLAKLSPLGQSRPSRAVFESRNQMFDRGFGTTAAVARKQSRQSSIFCLGNLPDRARRLRNEELLPPP